MTFVERIGAGSVELEKCTPSSAICAAALGSCGEWTVEQLSPSTLLVEYETARHLIVVRDGDPNLIGSFAFDALRYVLDDDTEAGRRDRNLPWS